MLGIYQEIILVMSLQIQVNSIDSEIEIGNLVEANQNGERFWVRVTDKCVCYIIGIVVSELVFSHPIQ